MSLLTTVLTLFLIMDSIGNINGYLKLVQNLDRARQRRVVIRELLIALLLLFAFNFLGEFLLAILDLSDMTVAISSGLILFLIAIRMIFTGQQMADFQPPPQGEPFIVPIATPMIAGPSALATVMLYARGEPNPFLIPIAILIAWLASAAIMLGARNIKQVLGDKTLLAIERLMGLLITMLSVEMLLRGIQLYVRSSFQ